MSVSDGRRYSAAVVKRSYQQYCGLAVALDVVGERWALLIVRDLVPGPRRYTDLLAGLPGLATDVLAERLRSLEAAGAVTQTTLTHPVPARVYELTDRGRELSRIAGALAGWGAAPLPDPVGAPHRKNPRWALQSMTSRYEGGLVDGDYHWTIDGADMTVRIAERTAQLRYGPPPTDAVFHIRCTAPDFYRLLTGPPITDRRHDIAIYGRADLVIAFFDAMPMALPHSGPEAGASARNRRRSPAD